MSKQALFLPLVHYLYGWVEKNIYVVCDHNIEVWAHHSLWNEHFTNKGLLLHKAYGKPSLQSFSFNYKIIFVNVKRYN